MGARTPMPGLDTSRNSINLARTDVLEPSQWIFFLTCNSQSNPEDFATKQDLARLETRIQSLETSKRNLEIEVQSLKASNLYLEAQLKTKQDLTPPISFRAGFSNDPSPVKYSNGQIVVFDKIYLNDGNAYTAHSGMFRAPVSGLYIFTLHVLPSSGAMSFIIVQDNKSVAHMEGTASGGTESMQIAVHVHKNQDVWISKIWGDGDTLRGQMLSTFSGFLLRIDDDKSHNSNGGSIVVG
ncbi:EMILIN-2-like [Gigantopelta aegis]|uniref:EMILIN-2-like n=1 Tax=Gigantopelta aegis TaxID=1735272 RepID=UPI001B88B022|nr:EMILIN-2-like [Gigantopelta aegis]